MSAFLSKIHFQLYDKIKYQEYLATQMLEQCDTETKLFCKEHFPLLPTGTLDTVIDTSNIHGWLQESIFTVEKRVNYILEQMEQMNIIDSILLTVFQEGKKLSVATCFTTVDEAFIYIQQHALEGMPCDQGIQIMDKEEGKITFTYLDNIHPDIKNFSLFLQIKTEWIKGILDDCPISLKKVDTTTYQLVKENL